MTQTPLLGYNIYAMLLSCIDVVVLTTIYTHRRKLHGVTLMIEYRGVYCGIMALEMVLRQVQTHLDIEHIILVVDSHIVDAHTLDNLLYGTALSIERSTQTDKGNN